MSQETFVVAYDDDTADTGVLDCAIARAQKSGAKLLIIHVLEWSPYSFLSQEELAARGKRRAEELDRARDHVIAPALERAKTAGVEAEGVTKHGSVADLVVRTARDASAAFIFVGRSGSGEARARIFGSVPLAIAQVADIPTVIVP
ncbi:Universal stress protein family protein [Rhodobacteraceae bacterium THAF1]|uniref:universal stress protein n=1 Tax=Palleronia sp. THAF1 TaxID=2587842 RepID=UPI000F415A29|nr:universal stress protein [Palleronia sp. THAF1]QFU10125.1 Universal stress protein family protein [Palleronia sp. THAF1]VDC16970.1 Universal stress protein family protein [Rhodobacteraceae bacterium THAF1]